jgi:hypothetical protein
MITLYGIFPSKETYKRLMTIVTSHLRVITLLLFGVITFSPHQLPVIVNMPP